MWSMRVSQRLLLPTLLVLAGCSSDPSSGPVPSPGPSLSIEAPAGTWYPGDVTTLRAIVRDANGVEVPGAPITWGVSHASRAEVAADGATTFLSAGDVTITARSGSLVAQLALRVNALSVQSVSIVPGELQLRRGDAVVFGVRVQGEGGRDVLGRVVTLATDNPAIASLDASGRIHAISPGVTFVRATSEGVTGSARVVVSDTPATHELVRVGTERLPLLVSADTVTWNGVREYHEVFLEGGTLELSGGQSPTYAIDIRYAEYRVSGPVGNRTYVFLLSTHERDFGTVQRDARGDLVLTSSYISPLQHTATPASDGMRVHFRIPGDDIFLDLLYRRE